MTKPAFGIDVDDDGRVYVGMQSTSIGLGFVAPLPQFSPLGQPMPLNGLAAVAQLSADGQRVEQLSPLVRSAIFLPVRMRIVGQTLHVATTANDRNVFIGNAIAQVDPPALDAATNRDAYLGRFDIRGSTGLALSAQTSLGPGPHR